MSTNNLSQNVIWVDLNSVVGMNGKSELVTNLDSIDNSIYNILTCPIDSRGWQPLYGSMIPFLLWEPVDQITADAIKSNAATALAQWEPRIDMLYDRSTVTPTPNGTGYDVVIAYLVRATGTVGSTQFRLLK